MRVAHSEAMLHHYITRFGLHQFLNEDLLHGLQVFTFPAQAPVYIEQDEQHYLYFLVEGQVQCSHYHLNGRLAVFALSNPFSAIGDVEVLTEERLFSTVIATQDSTMLGLNNTLVERYGADDPRFLRFLIAQLREKLYKTNQLQSHQVLPLNKRLAVYLLTQPADEGEIVVLPDKDTLASLLGTTTRHLNRVLKTLIESECISADYPCVRLLNRAALHDLIV